MRNVIAHRYGSLDTKILWETIIEDIPILYAYCNSILKNHEVLQKASINNQDKWDIEI